MLCWGSFLAPQRATCYFAFPRNVVRPRPRTDTISEKGTIETIDNTTPPPREIP